MAFSSNLVKEWYKNLSIKELEQKYKELEEDYYFESKIDQIKYQFKYFMDASHNTNLNATRSGLEELLKEKTGKDYKLKTRFFHIDLCDILDYIANTSNLITNQENILKFFNSIDKIEDEEIDESAKIWFLICLYQNKDNFKNFVKDLKKSKDNIELFKKYYDICEEYYSDNSSIG